MSEITLTRIKLKNDGDADETVCMRLTDLDGKMISVAFEGRADCINHTSVFKEFTYSLYNDGPLVAECARQGRNVPDVQVMREIRDSLILMNLGD